MKAEEKLIYAGFENTKHLIGYDDALVGVSHDGRAIYDYNLMIDWLMSKENWSDDEAVEWIEYNTIRALPYMGEGAPIIMYGFEYLE